MSAPTFRGYRAIEEVLQRARPLCEWFQKNRPECRSIRLAPKDFDLIVRWPKAAGLHGLVVAEGRVTLALGGGQFRIDAPRWAWAI